MYKILFLCVFMSGCCTRAFNPGIYAAVMNLKDSHLEFLDRSRFDIGKELDLEVLNAQKNKIIEEFEFALGLTKNICDRRHVETLKALKADFEAADQTVRQRGKFLGELEARKFKDTARQRYEIALKTECAQEGAPACQL